MPEKHESFVCKFCGTEFNEPGEADNCEKSHLHVPDMKIAYILPDEERLKCYQSQSIWPRRIRVKCTSRVTEEVIYELVKPRRLTRES